LPSIGASVSFEAPLFQAWWTIGSEMTLVTVRPETG